MTCKSVSTINPRISQPPNWRLWKKVTPENQVEIRKVKLGLQTATEVQILAGVESGEMVVIGNRAGLQAGQTVAPKITAMSTAQ